MAIPEEAKEKFFQAGYRIVGNHSAVEICHWTKESLRKDRICYKEKWYGIGKHNWKRLSKRIIERDNFTCQSCGVSLHENKPNVHHIVPYSISKDNSESNLVALCVPCHASIEYYTQIALSSAGGEAVVRTE